MADNLYFSISENRRFKLTDNPELRKRIVESAFKKVGEENYVSAFYIFKALADFPSRFENGAMNEFYKDMVTALTGFALSVDSRLVRYTIAGDLNQLISISCPEEHKAGLNNLVEELAERG